MLGILGVWQHHGTVRPGFSRQRREHLHELRRGEHRVLSRALQEFDELSVAFAKEESAEAASETILPARPISNRINLVTEAGLRMLQEALAEAQRALAVANALEDVNERRRQSAVPVRDIRYYSQRVETARLSAQPPSNDVVAFGHTVSFERDDGRVQTYRIVGEDEANPSQASISHGSPVAIALMGKSVGDVVELKPHSLEILSIDWLPDGSR